MAPCLFNDSHLWFPLHHEQSFLASFSAPGMLTNVACQPSICHLLGLSSWPRGQVSCLVQPGWNHQYPPRSMKHICMTCAVIGRIHPGLYVLAFWLTNESSWVYYSSSVDNRRKFRSQTSDNMDRWKSRGGKSQRGEAKKWEEQRRERVRRKKMQVREKVGKSGFTVFFQSFVALGGRKVGSLKRRVQSHLGRWDMKNCTPLWREAHVQVKNVQNRPFSDHLWKFCCRKSARRCGVQNTPFSDHFWKLRCRKSARSCGAKHVWKSKMSKVGGLSLFWRSDVEKKSRWLT